jgi:hypothetical protein
VALCQVKYKDIEGIVHQVDVQAQSLFEAVAAAASQFRQTLWSGHPPGPGCEFTVRVLPKASAQTYTILLHQVEEFARNGAVKGAKGIVQKNKLRELLGIAE